MFGGRLRTDPQVVKSLHFSRPSGVRSAVFRAFPLWAWTSLPWLPAILHPTLIIAGDDDPITPLVNHRIMAHLIPRARLHIVPGGGHLVLLDSPEMVAPEIVAFLGQDH
jgi:pimeloyl-ACP methyl ester carboxylesterase